MPSVLRKMPLTAEECDPQSRGQRRVPSGGRGRGSSQALRLRTSLSFFSIRGPLSVQHLVPPPSAPREQLRCHLQLPGPPHFAPTRFSSLIFCHLYCCPHPTGVTPGPTWFREAVPVPSHGMLCSSLKFPLLRDRRA